jgi:hypothetical protein
MLTQFATITGMAKRNRKSWATAKNSSKIPITRDAGRFMSLSSYFDDCESNMKIVK